MKTPLVSVITPCYNSASFIAQAIQSVQNQTYANWEMIVVDDCSTDASVVIVEQLAANDPRIILRRLEQNSGTGVARNTAIELASGRYIAFLDADDLWMPEKLSTQIKFMEQHSLPFTFSFYDWIAEDGTDLQRTITTPAELRYRDMLYSNWIGNLTAIYDVDYFGKIAIPKIRKRQDWMLWLTILRSIGKARPVPQSLAFYRIRKDSISASKYTLMRHNYNVYRHFHKFGILKSALSMIAFLLVHFLVRPRYAIKKTKP